MIYWVVGYIVIVVDGMIGLYACHQSPYGVRCTWRDLWRQLCYRAPDPLPRAYLKTPAT